MIVNHAAHLAVFDFHGRALLSPPRIAFGNLVEYEWQR
jgi:hypothetical protein